MVRNKAKAFVRLIQDVLFQGDAIVLDDPQEN